MKHMFICGSNFVGGALGCSLTPTGLKDLDYMELKNGIYDDLYVTKAVDFEMDETYEREWNFDTILWAKFNGNTNAGNVDWSVQTVSHLLLKSRNHGDFIWKTLFVKEINSREDFVVNYPDYFAASGATVEYAIVPVLYGTEGNYAISTATPKFTKLFLIEGDTVWGTDLTDGFCDTARSIPSSTVELLHRKYPIFIRNTIANYDTGACTGVMLPFVDEDACELAFDPPYDYQRIRYQKAFMDFLCDGIPKILKLPDGRIWIVQVTPDPTDTADTVYNNRQISWSWVEVGDVSSEEDLYYLGLSEVGPEWWTK
ncbi:MAG: hypothetical protein HFI30_16825 [Lachnospiraceae bacterium]|jgi:hypothetical protein|nr:hypothetical protein [Lachnospiraceae bacterium]